MKQVAQNYKTGEITLEDVPLPACKAGGLIVRTEYSLISMGTEMMKVAESKMSLLGKAKARPDQVKKVMQTVAQQGLFSTYKKVMNKLDMLTPLGYSLCGVVEEVGSGVDGFSIGDRVACAGNKYALHAEYNWVPKNLCVPVPRNVKSEVAAFTTVASIAMQGFRQSEAKLGEMACVIGLGLLGQILVQLLRAAGIHVVGFDVSEDRCKLAEAMGAISCGMPGTPSEAVVVSALSEHTNGAGSDYVFITAGGNSNQPIEMAARLSRDRARIIDIGKCKLDIPWNDYYMKELELRFTRSYGPGRYDPNYEEAGNDYPIGYVRWTEKRNMESCLSLMSTNQLQIAPLISEIFSFGQAPEVYENMNSGKLNALGMLFKYPDNPDKTRVIGMRVASLADVSHERAGAGSVVRLGVIGCGNYASSMLLPHLNERNDIKLCEVATASSLSAANAHKKFGFDRYSTDYKRILEDSTIDAVLIATRHSSHSSIVSEALRAGKAVFVEKPLAVNENQLDQVINAINESKNHRLMVGFNRRFSKMLVELRKSWGNITEPLIIQYNINAGRLDNDSWYMQSETEGSRFIGEGCHFIDTVSWWLGRNPVAAYATNTGNDIDNAVATLSYEDGSIATISYITKGENKYPKEIMHVYGQGKVAKLHNFERAELWQGGKSQRIRSTFGVDKGQKAELEEFVQAVKTGSFMPINLESLVATTRATFSVMKSIKSRSLEHIQS